MFSHESLLLKHECNTYRDIHRIFPRKFNVMQHNILKAQIARYHV
jgi:hypothetical protein